ncbi:MAG: heavy metal translocating P-type ATPase [Tepidisphaerales bacterium]
MSSATDKAVLCDHCRLPVPKGLVRPGSDVQFCCAGCEAVYAAVTGCGLDGYYRLRDAAAATLTPARPGRSGYAALDSSAFESVYVERHPEDERLRTVDLQLEGVTCAACVWLVEKLPEVLPGVVEARLSLGRSTVRVTWDATRVKLSEVARTLDRFGYPVHPSKGRDREAAYRREFRRRLIHLGVAGALAGNLMLLAAALYAGWTGHIDGASEQLLRWVSLGLGMLSLAWPGGEFFRSAWRAIRHRTVNLDVPICIALGVGGVAGVVNVVLGRGELYFDSLAALVFLLLVGRFLQFRQQRSAESSVELLFSLTPSTCRVLGPDGEVNELPLEGLRPGDVAVVRPGELIPADGVVEHGQSMVNQALLTGESAPVRVGVGTTVYGGSHNGPAVLHVRVTRVGEASRVGQLMRLLEKGLSEKPEIVRFADRVAVAFTVAVSVLGAAVLGYWAWRPAEAGGGLAMAIDHTVAFLIVTCPCVLGLATPMTLAVAIGRLAKRDILVKSGGALEKLARGGTLVLDKTGTLTEGRLRVVAFEGDADARGLIAAIESASNHPVARALVEAFGDVEPPAAWRVDPACVRELTGLGVVASLHGGGRAVVGSEKLLTREGVAAASLPHTSGEPAAADGCTWVYAAVDGRVVARVALADRLRADVKSAVERLHSAGFTPVICSGDSSSAVHAVARALSVPADRVWAEVSPEDKLAVVKRLDGGQGRTVMVGDGVNDAAALAAAGVGIAVHGGSDVSLAAADVYTARPGLSAVVELVETARRAMRVIYTNFGISLTYNVVAGTLAATGWMNPLMAAVIMPMSSLTVVSFATWAMSRKR